MAFDNNNDDTNMVALHLHFTQQRRCVCILMCRYCHQNNRCIMINSSQGDDYCNVQSLEFRGNNANDNKSISDLSDINSY